MIWEKYTEKAKRPGATSPNSEFTRDPIKTPPLYQPRRIINHMKPLSARALSLFLMCALCGCLTDTTTVQEAISPDKKHVAVAQVYDGGATTSWAPQVYIRHYPNYKKWWYSESEDERVFSGYHSDKIAVKWASDAELIIYCKCTVEYLVDTYWGIKITHKWQIGPKQ
jgi:hypothetical protein